MSENDEFDDLIQEIEGKIQKDESEIYTERTREEAYNPKNAGELKEPSAVGRIRGPCGDTVQIHLRIEGDVISDTKFITDGCGPSIACGSVVTELVKGKTVEEAEKVTPEDILAVLGDLPEDNLHCPVLAINTLKAALEDYRNTRSFRNQSISE
ncbi:nitrogen fixation protein NifU [Candidatus Methanophagaceae archaeon]|jgi:nitrogen fixation NifU-like protein|nr:nitrogen fixation protein NifU [Methanophagales archaeon]